LEPPLCVVSSWVIIKVYTILVWNTISGSFNLDICYYHCLILTLIFHLKVLINFFFIIFIINIITITITITITTTTTTSIIIVVVVVVVSLLLSIIYIINLPVVWPRSCRVIYYFDTPALGRRHQSFGRVINQKLRPLWAIIQVWQDHTYSSTSSDSIGTTRKTASGNSCKNLSTIQDQIKSYGPFELLFKCGSTTPPLQRVVIL
jgi:hypothetical protein